MAEIDTPTSTMRERLAQLLADWGAEMSMVLDDLEDARGRVAEVEQGSAGGREEVEELRRRVSGQEKLIETLQADALEAARLRKLLHATELEAEKLRSELETKLELIKALRKTAARADRLVGEIEQKDRELDELGALNHELEQRLADAKKRVAAAEASISDHQDETTEMVAIRAELDAKSTLIRSLRTDAQRYDALERQLDEKRVTIAKLEESLDRQAATIAELKDSVQRWKDRCAASADVASERVLGDIAGLPLEVAVAEREADSGVVPASDEAVERTLAIDMREALRQARETGDGESKGKAAGG